ILAPGVGYSSFVVRRAAPGWCTEGSGCENWVDGPPVLPGGGLGVPALRRAALPQETRRRSRSAWAAARTRFIGRLRRRYDRAGVMSRGWVLVVGRVYTRHSTDVAAVERADLDRSSSWF